MQQILALLVDLIIQLLESSFRTKQQETPDDDFFSSSSSPDKDETKLEEAYKFMELERASVLSDNVLLKKQYKKLSLRYHPDRNGGSEESKVNFQKLTACLDLIEKDLAGLLSGREQHNDDDSIHSNEEREEEEDDNNYSRRHELYEEMLRQAKNEMRQEMKRQKEMKKEFQKNYSADRHRIKRTTKARGLHKKSNREAENEEFEHYVRLYEEHWQNDTASNDGNFGRAGENEEEPTKPKNIVMECNTTEIVAALRLDIPEIALACMSRDLQDHVSGLVSRLAFERRRDISEEELVLHFFLNRLDDDANTLLHYAVYYESYQVIHAICSTAQHLGILEYVIHQCNEYGQTPIYFSKVARDPSIITLMQSQTDYVEALRARTRVGPALVEAKRRLFDLAQHVGFVSTIDTLVSFWVMTFNLPSLGALAALIVSTLSSNWMVGAHSDQGVSSASALISFSLCWKVIQWGARLLLRLVMWELILLMAAPFAIAACFSSGGRLAFSSILVTLLTWYCYLSRYIEVVLVSCRTHCTPRIIKKNGLTKLYFLALVAILPKVATTAFHLSRVRE